MKSPTSHKTKKNAQELDRTTCSLKIQILSQFSFYFLSNPSTLKNQSKGYNTPFNLDHFQRLLTTPTDRKYLGFEINHPHPLNLKTSTGMVSYYLDIQDLRNTVFNREASRFQSLLCSCLHTILVNSTFHTLVRAVKD